MQYTTWCDAHGKVIDDGTISRLGENVFRLTSAEPSFRWLHRNAFALEVGIEDVSESLGALALQGPLSRAVLNEAADHPVDALRYFRVMDNRIAGVEIQVSRTGYTGDLGYELWIPADRALEVWDALMAVGRDYGLAPAGIWALDVARIEAGLIMLDVDYHSSHRAMIEAAKVHALRTLARLDRQLRQGAVQRPQGAGRGKGAGDRCGASSESRSSGIRSSRCMSRATFHRRCRGSPGAPASRCIATADRSVTPRAAAGRRS